MKYKKHIMTDLEMPEDVQYRAAEYSKRAKRILWLEDQFVEGAFSVICSWYFKATEKEGTPSHVHDFHEVVGFLGSDPENPVHLGGKVEFWMEDEKYILDKSCLIYVPAGLQHCPLRVVQLDKPILFLAISATKKYTKKLTS